MISDSVIFMDFQAEKFIVKIIFNELKRINEKI